MLTILIKPLYGSLSVIFREYAIPAYRKRRRQSSDDGVFRKIYASRFTERGCLWLTPARLMLGIVRNAEHLTI